MLEKKEKIDVIIVGGGPAGSTAGYILARLGLKVLLIDKEVFPRRKLCGGLVSVKSLYLLKKIFNESIASLKEKNIFDYIADHYEVNYGAEKIMIAKSSPLPFYFTDRAVYDDFLLKKAKKVGVKVLEGIKVESIDISTNEITLANGDKYIGDYIIGADGANSIVRRELITKKIINKSKWINGLGSVLECMVDKTFLDPEKTDHMTIFFGFIKWGYAFIFPHKDVVYLGLGGSLSKNKGNYMKLFNKFLSALKISKENCSKIEGMTVPFGNYDIKHVYKDKIILIGDAGGFIDPMFGEGIYYAQRTAEYVAYAISQNKKYSISVEDLYERLLESEIYPEMNGVKRLNRFTFNKLNFSTKFFVMKVLFKILEKIIFEAINGVRSYRTLRKRSEISKFILGEK